MRWFETQDLDPKIYSTSSAHICSGYNEKSIFISRACSWHGLMVVRYG